MTSQSNTATEATAQGAQTSAAGNWYALYTCPRHEKMVAEQIKRCSFTCFLPVYSSVRRWKDRRKELELALFPGYVFVHMALEKKLKVLEIPGAVRLVSFNGQPVALPAGEIEMLKDRLSGARGVEPHRQLPIPPALPLVGDCDHHFGCRDHLGTRGVPGGRRVSDGGAGEPPTGVLPSDRGDPFGDRRRVGLTMKRR